VGYTFLKCDYQLLLHPLFWEWPTLVHYLYFTKLACPPNSLEGRQWDTSSPADSIVYGKWSMVFFKVSNGSWNATRLKTHSCSCCWHGKVEEIWSLCILLLGKINLSKTQSIHLQIGNINCSLLWTSKKSGKRLKWYRKRFEWYDPSVTLEWKIFVSDLVVLCLWRCVI
jgi:hypothetical protein